MIDANPPLLPLVVADWEGTNRTDYKPMYSFAMFKRVLWRTLANFLIQE